MTEVEVLEPKDHFWQVQIEILEEDENGKVKKNKEVHLVDSPTAGGCEKIVAEAMKGTIQEWKIVSVTLSKVIMVY